MSGAGLSICRHVPIDSLEGFIALYDLHDLFPCIFRLR